jgi:hypothetical protein
MDSRSRRRVVLIALLGTALLFLGYGYLRAWSDRLHYRQFFEIPEGFRGVIHMKQVQGASAPTALLLKPPSPFPWPIAQQVGELRVFVPADGEVIVPDLLRLVTNGGGYGYLPHVQDILMEPSSLGGRTGDPARVSASSRAPSGTFSPTISSATRRKARRSGPGRIVTPAKPRSAATRRSAAPRRLGVVTPARVRRRRAPPAPPSRSSAARLQYRRSPQTG